LKVSNSQIDRSTQKEASAASNRHQFLRFSLQPGLTALIEIERVMELVNIPIDRVVPMPHLPPAVRGVYNWRGEILWIVDLAILLGIGATAQRFRSIQPTIVLSSAGEVETSNQRPEQSSVSATEVSSAKTIGFIVDEILEIEWCQLDLLDGSLPTHLNPELAQWVRGIWESPSGEDLLVLDGQTILDRANFHANARSDLNYFFR
jgi:positive phototaxis protein PixI